MLHVKNLIFESLLGPHKGGITTSGNKYSVGWDDFQNQNLVIQVCALMYIRWSPPNPFVLLFPCDENFSGHVLLKTILT